MNFAPGDRVVIIGLGFPLDGVTGTVVDKKADPDRVWVKYDNLPEEYAQTDTDGCSETLKECLRKLTKLDLALS